MFSSYRSAARFLNRFNYSNFYSQYLTLLFPLFSSAFLFISFHLPPHVLALVIMRHLLNPLFESSTLFWAFLFHMLSGLFLFFPGTRFGAAPWEARCCFEQCRIRSHKGCLCGGSRWQGRAGTEGKIQPQKTKSTRVSPMKTVGSRTQTISLGNINARTS